MQLDRAFLSDPENRCACKRFICGENKHICLKCSENAKISVHTNKTYIYICVHFSVCV